ncbi:7263_t:CDS:1 [Acaulospora colombiana]|uniref:7263_t:CDS:1 n=1 Tax=Acaulospora colombiana TaxID=27376 RepID=A0ACA9KLR4_9GLOM|nr:7263_t:CDS:1 [Acaulospora colombiana]
MFGITSINLPRSQSLEITFTHKKQKKNNNSTAQSYGAPLQLDRYLTNEGHRIVASYLRQKQTQGYVQKGYFHKINEKDLDDLIKSCEGVATRTFETLNYEDLHLSHRECKLLARFLKSENVVVRTLMLRKNHLAGTPLKVLLKALRKNSTVRILDLSSNLLTDVEAKWVAKLLKKNSTIKELYLASNRIGSDGAKHLAKALEENTTVERLSLESNRLSEKGGGYIADMLKINNTIKYIHLGSNNLQLAGIKEISEALKVNSSLVSLSLDVNNIAPEGTNFVSEALKVNKTLTHLYLPRNNIGDQGLKNLSKALLSNTTIAYLDLEFNNIGINGDTEGMEVMGKLLENHIVPRALNLTNNHLGDEGCSALFSGFHKNKTLESLILSHCNIGLDGTRAIGKALRDNVGLQNLSLHMNSDVGADGHLELAQALEKNTSIKGIQLDYNFAEWESVGNSIHQSLTRNHFLQREKYSVACRIEVAARIMLNSNVKQQLPTYSRNSKTIKKSGRPGKPPTSTSPQKLTFTKLPFEIQEQILFSIDENHVLTHLQLIEIIKWSMKRSTLGKSMKEFLTKTFSAYYPLTSDVKLWPTEATDFGGTSTERF